MTKIRLKPDEISIRLLNERNKNSIGTFSSTVCKELENFLKENAWDEQFFGFSKTYLFFHKEVLTGYVTILMDIQKFHSKKQNVFLHRLKDKTVYDSVPALKIGRLCVSDDYNSQLESSKFSGLGTIMFSSILDFAINLSNKVGCRLITTHAKKSTGAYKWYERLGFVHSYNEEKTKELLTKVSVDSMPMFYDLKRIIISNV